MTNKLFSLLMSYATRQARKDAGRVWWVVLGALALVRRLDSRSHRDVTETHKVKTGQTLNISVDEQRHG